MTQKPVVKMDLTDNKQDALAQGSILEEFKEVDEVNNIISSISKIYKNQIPVEMAVEKFLFIMDQYQEQPHLLDPHLEKLIEQLLEVARNKVAPIPVIHLAFKLLYLVTKTRGFKVVVRLLPHEVADLEPVLNLLSWQDPMDFESWETRYMLLLWLSMVCMIPFDMSRLDSHARAQWEEGKKPTMDRIIDTAKQYLYVSDKSRDAAAYLLSRFMTRHDVREKKLAEFLDYSLVTLQKANTHTSKGLMTLLGIMSSLALLVKHGKREDMLSFAPTVLQIVTDPQINLKNSNNIVVRKLAVKLIQRLGLTFLKPRVATWRYERGSRSLADTLSPSGPKSGQSDMETDEDEEEYDIPDEIEEVIEQLLTGLKDKDTVVRWSAAKGVGRVLSRLPKDLADEVVGSIMEMFTKSETDGAWHGGCLALAELGRRGLLLPERLPKVVPVIIKALCYDEKRGNFSVGAHVRDAACYVCWAFARAYDPEELKPHVPQIASSLVIASVFDREINVRRAAAAAFQENVGRQGQFPHGIDILTTCDYFAVGNRITCYLNLSVYVAQFSEYTKALIDHLVDYKILHWDKSVRELSAEALHNLTVKDPQYMAHTVLPNLATMAIGMDLALRHGSILSAGYVAHALFLLAEERQLKIDGWVHQDTLTQLKDITTKLHDAKLFRGVGGELMREAVCCLIKKLSLSHCPFHTDPIIETWKELIDDCLQHLEPDIQAAAIDAIPAFFSEYYRDQNGKVKVDMQEKILSEYLSQLKSTIEATRQGFALAIGALPDFMIKGHLDEVLTALIHACTVTVEEKKYGDSRRDAMKALTSLCCTVGVQTNGSPKDTLCASNVPVVYDAMFTAMQDYTLDSRGDVGAWVREATMTGLYDLTSLLLNSDPSLISDDICRKMFCSLVQQACEKIDRTRAHAGDVLSRLLYHEPPLTNIPCKSAFENLFPRKNIKIINWGAPSDTFPKFIQLLGYPEYMYHVLLGIAISMGGLTESLVKHSASSMRDYLRTMMYDKIKMQAYGDTFVKVFKDHQKIDRVTLPLLKMLDQLLTIGCFTILTEDENSTFAADLCAACKQEISKCGDPHKLKASIDVFCGMMQFPGDIQKKMLSQLMIFLCHKYPMVRKTTATNLYEAIVTFDGLVADENMEEVMTILSETQWDKPVPEIRPLRNKVCALFDVPQPVAANKPAEVK